MEERPSIKGFLKGLFETAKNPVNPEETKPDIESPAITAAPPVAAPPTPKPRTEAYLSRRKGRPIHPTRFGYWPVIAEYLVRREEAAPGEMAKDLGLPKSTLIYNLNTLMKVSQLDPKAWYSGVSEKPHVENYLGGKRLVRTGAGKYVRYRLVDHPESASARSNL